MNTRRLLFIRQILQNLTGEEAAILLDALETKINLLSALNEELKAADRQYFAGGKIAKDLDVVQALFDKLVN